MSPTAKYAQRLFPKIASAGTPEPAPKSAQNAIGISGARIGILGFVAIAATGCLNDGQQSKGTLFLRRHMQPCDDCGLEVDEITICDVCGRKVCSCCFLETHDGIVLPLELKQKNKISTFPQ